jgi:hypothetical protein
MNLAINNEDILSKLNQTFSWTSQQKEMTYRQNIRSYYYKSFGYFQIIEICLLILILFEHTFVFILTFKKNSSKKTEK